MLNNDIQITDYDLERLRELLRIEKLSGKQKETLTQLEKELERAKVTSSGKISADVVTMNSRVRIKDVDTNEEMIFQLVFPSDANLDVGKLSILSRVVSSILDIRLG